MGRDKDELIILRYTRRVTEAAFAVLFEFDDRPVWIPKSTISEDEDDGFVTIPLWLVEREELEDYVED